MDTVDKPRYDTENK
ncbi:MAG TPA: hypothetical protein LFW21_00180 [Rickettsia endosymbiont of Pyrocoelia pectoralis]|nr:hypothetical protein [Rickettsia endosymbiont of Pyrocoelia pectoralis]